MGDPQLIDIDDTIDEEGRERHRVVI